MSVFRKEVRVTLGDVAFPLVAEFNFAIEIGAWKAGHSRVTTRRR